MPKRSPAPVASDAEVAEKLLELIHQAEEPVARSALSKHFKGSYRRTDGQLDVLLESLAEEGRVHRFSPARGKASRYWDRDPAVYAEQVYRAALAKGPKTFTALDKPTAARLGTLSPGERKEMLDRFVREGRLFLQPGKTARAAPLFALHAPDPREYVRGAVKSFFTAVEKVAKLLESYGVSPAETRQAALQAIGPAVPAGERRPSQAGQSHDVPAACEQGEAPFAERFDRAFSDLDRQKGSHNLVSLVDLRRALAPTVRAEFDRGIQELRASGRYGLSAAESVQGVRPEDREAAIEEAGALLLHVSRKA
jgi:hypothetical protein